MAVVPHNEDNCATPPHHPHRELLRVGIVDQPLGKLEGSGNKDGSSGEKGGCLVTFLDKMARQWQEKVVWSLFGQYGKTIPLQCVIAGAAREVLLRGKLSQLLHTLPPKLSQMCEIFEQIALNQPGTKGGPASQLYGSEVGTWEMVLLKNSESV